MNVEKTSKVFKFLKEVHSETILPKKVRIYDLARKHQLGSLASTVLIKNKLVTFDGATKKSRLYKWNTILPNVKMAEEFYNRYSDEVKEMNTKSRSTTPKVKDSVSTEISDQNDVVTPRVKRKYTKRVPQVEVSTVVEEHKKETRTFSFAWGLIKFNY